MFFSLLLGSHHPLEDSICLDESCCFSTYLEFVTGWGGAGFHSPGPALTTGRGGYFGGDSRPAPVRGESALIPWKGPCFSPPVLTGTRLGNGRGRGQGQGTLKKHAPPRAVQRGGTGNWAGGPRFSGPQRPRNEHYTYPVNYTGTLVSFVVSSRIDVILSNRIVGVIMGGLLQ